MRVVLDCDPGNGVPGANVDDGLALGLALRSPEIQLEAVTVVAGNVPVDRGVRCALEVLEAAGAAALPVHRGADRPLVADPRPWRTRLDARLEDPRACELWATDPRAGQPLEAAGEAERHGVLSGADPSPAAQALVDIVDRAPGEVTVVAVGPLTNIATAILIDPEWPTKVQRLVLMGGAFDVPDVLQELNASYDPEATHVVLSCSAPVLVVPLDVTVQTRLRIDDVDRLDRAGTSLATYLGRTARPWVTWLSERFGRDGCPLHDPLALATLVDPQVVSTRSACVDIELAGRLTRGRTISWSPTDQHPWVAGLPLPDVRPVTLADGVDDQRFVRLLLDRLTS